MDTFNNDDSLLDDDALKTETSEFNDQDISKRKNDNDDEEQQRNFQYIVFFY